ESPRTFGHDQRRAAALGNVLNSAANIGRDRAALLVNERLDGLGRSFADAPHLTLSTGGRGEGGGGSPPTHPCLCRERNEGRIELVDVAAAQAIFLLGKHDDAAAFRSFVGEGC